MVLWCAKADPASRWDRLMRTVEVPFAAAVEAEKNRYIEEASQAFPITLRLSDIAFDVHRANMSAIAERYDMIAMRLALDEMADGIKSALPVVTKKWDSLWFYLVRQWVNEYGAARARETAATTRADMQRVIDRAFAPDGVQPPAGCHQAPAGDRPERVASCHGGAYRNPRRHDVRQ